MTLTDAERERLANMRDACQAAIDGKPWEVQNTVGEWRSPEPGSGLPMTYWRARAKPWSLPPPPEGRQWMMADKWKEGMLAEGERPLLHGEEEQKGDQAFAYGGWVQVGCYTPPHKFECIRKTTRPLPSAPVVMDWTPEEMIGKTVKSKSGGIYLITGAYEGHCEIGKSTYRIGSVSKYFTQLDGTPCGAVAQTPDPRA